MSTPDTDILIDRVKKILEQEEKKPFRVSVMGQTGVGKSSLINALFGTKLDISFIGPGTENIEEVSIEGRAGHQLIFYDLPGIGISEKADKEYLADYEQKLVESDVVLWAIHCDSRSFSYDLDALEDLFTSINILSESELLAKMIFVLTKVDLLTPPPWILAKIGANGVFVPQEEAITLLKAKEEYVRKNFIKPYRESLISRTYFNDAFEINDTRFNFENNVVTYGGILSKEELEELKKLFPNYQDIFERLYDNYRVVSVSSRFRFNLDLLIRLIINKLGTDAIARFGNFYTEKAMYIVPLKEAREYSNIVVVDRDEKKVIFDLASTDL